MRGLHAGMERYVVAFAVPDVTRVGEQIVHFVESVPISPKSSIGASTNPLWV